MARVISKRPVDVTTHVVDFTGYLPDALASAQVRVVGEGEDTPALLASVDTVADPLVSILLSDGTERVIYQVYVTGTSTSGGVQRLQFEVAMASQSEGAASAGGV